MKKILMLLGCAGALTMASCSSDNKDTSTATTTETTTTTSDASTARNVGYTDADYNSRADRIASDMAAQMKLDDATRQRVRTVYYNRAKRLGELHNQYMQDTTGMTTAMRDVYTQTDTEMHDIFTDPKQYSAYESSRDTYMEDRYIDTGMGTTSDMSSDSSSDMSSTDMASSADMSTTSSSDMSGSASVSKMKAKGADGKLKVKSDGDVKVKDAADNKAKVAGDDGTIKLKPENGQKSKM